MRRTIAAVAALLAASALLTGCDRESAGEPTAAAGDTSAVNQPSESNPTDEPGGPSDVPRVKEPLDPAKFLDTPCDLLPRAWAKSEGFEPGEKEKDPLVGPTCSWSTPVGEGDEGTIQVIIETVNQERGTGNLQAIYEDFQRYGSTRGGYFELTEVSGYPAAYHDTRDNRSEGETFLSVGIRDDLVMSIDAHAYFDEPEKAVSEAKAAAEQMMATLKGAQ